MKVTWNASNTKRFLFQTGSCSLLTLNSHYKLIGFPPITDERVEWVAIHGDLAVDGNVQFVIDRHGKLRWGKSYRSWAQPTDKSILKFEEATMQGQRVLVVPK